MVAISSTELLVFGGLRNPDGLGEAPTDQLWRLFKDGLGAWRWALVNPGGSPPSARYGHAAIHDAAGNRMIVFGGSEQLGQSPADSRVWALSLGGTPAWSELEVASGAGSQRPLPRRDHTMVRDPSSPTTLGSLLVYGGHVSTGAPSDTLWTLNLGAAPPAWSRTILSPSPGARAGHAAAYDDAVNGGRLFLYGGEPAGGGSVDNYVYMIEPFGALQWNQWQQVPFRLSQHTANLDAHLFAMARVPEIYTPGSDTWTPAPAAAWLQGYYPVQFLVPGTSLPGGGGRVVTVGQDPQARYLDIPMPGVSPGTWTNVGNGSSGDAGFQALTGVLYRPDKIMVAGGKPSSAPFDDAVGDTKRLDTQNLPAGWTPSATMLPRYYHNLVALPSGEVLAVGGITKTSDQVSDPSFAQVCPQMWSPTSDAWTPDRDLECDRVDEGGGPRNVVRNYHSAAILLPDGRVMSAGGAGSNQDKRKARVFCPPYLFKTDGTPAQRPVIGEWPRTIAWGDTFTICAANPTLIQKVSLVRPAATTHAFDQNQRHVPLEVLERRSSPAQLVVRAPASPDSAPPGNYLLFILGSQDGPDVPSLAQWVNLGCPSCDATAPEANNDLFIEIISESSVYPTWVAKGDNGTVGSATRYDIRRSTQPITAGNFASATRVGMPPPLCPGGMEFQEVGGLTPCTTYYFALKTGDGAGNWSAMSNVLQQQTIGLGACGGGGGGFTARRVEGGEGAGVSASAVARSKAGYGGLAQSSWNHEPTEASALDLETAQLLVETGREGDGSWRVTVRFATEADGLDPDGSSVLVEQTRASGERDVLGRIEPDATETRLGLCSLRERGRVAIRGVVALEQVTARLRHRGQTYALVEARHSRLGSLGAAFLADGGSPELLAGDALELSYAASGDAEPAAPSWYLVARRQGAAAPTPLAQHPGLDRSLLSRFALHPSEPNPTVSDVITGFDLPYRSPVKLEVFDLLGRRVATLANGIFPAGSHRAQWDLRDTGGTRVRPGVYVCRMTAGEFRAQRKMSVTR